MMRNTGYELSVIVPCLNEEQHIGSFLASMLSQHLPWQPAPGETWMPHPACELIIVDGGSSDATLRVIDSFRNRLRIIGIQDTTRNLGFIRNQGAFLARGNVLLFTNADAVLLPGFLDWVMQYFQDPQLAALSGRTIALDGGVICSAAYCAFDLLRWAFSKIGRFSPSGNFLAVRASVLKAIGGFRELRINEDGELGIRISEYARERGLKVKFAMSLAAAHYAERFRSGAVRTLLFYGYVFGNFSPVLRRILKPVEHRSARVF